MPARNADGAKIKDVQSLGDLSVLVIDDDPIVHATLRALFSALGIGRVAYADGSYTALTLLLRKEQAFDVIFCDLQMPGRDGVELFRDIADLRGSVNLVLMSGEDDSVLGAAADLASRLGLQVAGTLPKPMEIAAIRDALSRLSDAKSRTQGGPRLSVDVAELRQAIERREIVPYYQPKVAVATRKPAGVEALARWIHPERGLIGPDLFIPLAEEHGLINALTDVVLEAAIAQCRTWQERGLSMKMSVNLSVDSLDRLDLPEHLARAVSRAGLDPTQLVLELTESRFTDNPISLLDITIRLRLKQFALSIDDFGTGFSGLRQLQRLPFTELKVDRAFVSGASEDHRARAILESSVDMARKLGMTVVAEGVEKRKDWDLVASLGCDLVQGYYASRPLPADEIPAWLDDWRSRG